MTRYQSDPAQATAYMIGQLEIKKARSYSKGALGDDFSLRDFHYQVRLLLLALSFNDFSKEEKGIKRSESLFAGQLSSCHRCVTYIVATNGVQNGENRERVVGYGGGSQGVISM